MWRKWFAKIGFFVVELHGADGNNYICFAERWHGHVYTKLKLNNHVYTLRLWSDNTTNHNIATSWKQLK